jgi:hypothetical protein
MSFLCLPMPQFFPLGLSICYNDGTHPEGQLVVLQSRVCLIGRNRDLGSHCLTPQCFLHVPNRKLGVRGAGRWAQKPTVPSGTPTPSLLLFLDLSLPRVAMWLLSPLLLAPGKGVDGAQRLLTPRSFGVGQGSPAQQTLLPSHRPGPILEGSRSVGSEAAVECTS